MTRVLAGAVVALCVMAGVALADDAPDADAKAKPESAGEAVATGEVSARMTIPGGKFLFNAIVESNLAKKEVGKPFSIAPDLWIGASDKLTIGLIHSGRGETGFLTGAGRGLCFGDKDGACAVGLGKIYTSAGVEARIGLSEGSFPFALAIGGVVEQFKPKLVSSGKLGLIGRWQSNRAALELRPTVFAGLTQRKIADMSINEDVFSFPVTLFLKLSPGFAIALQSGVSMTIEHAADTYVVPAAAGLAWWVTSNFSIDVAFGLEAVVDKNDMTKAFDARSLSVGVGYGM